MQISQQRTASRNPQHLLGHLLHAFTTLIIISVFASTSIRPVFADDSAKKARSPNFVLILTDDQGYQDVGCFGSPNIKTPNLDRMAAEGMKCTDFYVGQAVCSASRAALMTGCYPNRVGILGALHVASKIGISDKELTMAQMLKKQGYATGMYGKWHLGEAPQFLPTRHGFDEYFGLPYSADMAPDYTPQPPLPRKPHDQPLYENEKIIERDPDQDQLTTRYTEHAVSYIERHKDVPFFLYVAHNSPHVPLHVSSKFRGKSERGLYGDVIMEVDWSVGQILAELKKAGIDDHTLVIFTSDNGPWLRFGDHGGSALPLREGKATTFDGGQREPCIVRWPGKIPAGKVCRELASTIDLMPTFAKLAGGAMPTDRVIDGRDIWPLLAGESGAKSPHEAFYFYWDNGLEAVRSGKWKLHFPHGYTFPDPPGHGGTAGKQSRAQIGISLFDLDADISEVRDVSALHPEVVEQLKAYAEKARDDLGDALTHRDGKNRREPGRLPEAAGVEKK